MRKMIRNAWVLAMFVLLFLCSDVNLQAAKEHENISVTVPSNLKVIFQADGTNAVSEFHIENQSVVPIHIVNIVVTEYNGWELVSREEKIKANQKKIAVSFNGQYLKEGDNLLQLTVEDGEVKTPNIQIERGAWTSNHPDEKALELGFEYAIGKKEFQLSFEGNEESLETVSVYNGEEVTLPIPRRIKYQFLGWEDEEGVLHQDTYLMPMKHVTLKAKWQWTEAYALYSSEDYSLTFVRSGEPISVGETYRGKVVSKVYTGFEDVVYRDNSLPPWWTAGRLEKAEVLDVIQPLGTAYWFYGQWYIHSMDLTKLDVSKVEDMTSMFSATGRQVPGTVTIMGLKNWDTSNVKYFGTAFRSLGENADKVVLDDISGWDTSSAVDMLGMFTWAAIKGNFYVDCSNWDVRNVKNHQNFSESAGGTILEPKWPS